MRATLDTALRHLLDQLSWSLDQPLNYGDRAWAVRVASSLDRLSGVFDKHVNAVTRCGGDLETVTGLLPFTDDERKGAELRQRLQLLREQLRCAAAEFRGALRLFPPSDDHLASAVATDNVQETRALLLFRALELCVRDVLAEVRACLAAERSVLQEG
jgi:hypothetical protein